MNNYSLLFSPLHLHLRLPLKHLQKVPFLEVPALVSKHLIKVVHYFFLHALFGNDFIGD